MNQSQYFFILNPISMIGDREKQVTLKLKEARENAKLSQLELSFLSGVSQNMITYIETGKRTPTLTTLLKLCDALHISPTVLFESPSEEVQKAKETVIELVNKYM